MAADMATTVATTTIPANPPFAPGAFMWRKYGPLPVWGYAGAVLALLLLYVWIRRGKASDQSATALAGKDSQTIAANTPKAPIFILPQTGLQGPPGPAGPPGANATDTSQPAGSGRDNPPGTTSAITPNAQRFINPDGTLSVGQGANLYAAAESVGLTGGQFAALNPQLWKPAAEGGNTLWSSTRDAAGNLTPTAARGMPYRIR